MTVHGEHEGAGRDAVDRKCTDQERGGDVSGDAERDCRDQVRAGHSTVRSLGGGDTLQAPGAEFLGHFRGPLGGAVAEETRERHAEARHHAHKRTDVRRANEGLQAGAELVPVDLLGSAVPGRHGGLRVFVGSPFIDELAQHRGHGQKANGEGVQ